MRQLNQLVKKFTALTFGAALGLYSCGQDLGDVDQSPEGGQSG